MGNLLIFLSDAMDIIPVIVVIAFAFGLLALFRFFWMWLIGINEVIFQLKESNKLLKLSLEEMRKNTTNNENQTL